MRTCVWHPTFYGGQSLCLCPGYLCLKGRHPGYIRVSAAFAGAIGVYFVFREAKPDQSGKKNGHIERV